MGSYCKRIIPPCIPVDFIQSVKTHCLIPPPVNSCLPDMDELDEVISVDLISIENIDLKIKLTPKFPQINF
jgi:hypothetical protein